MHHLIVILAALWTVVYGQTAVSQCLRNSGELPLSVNIEGCTTPPCGLPQLQDAVIDIEFIAPRNISAMTTLATAYFGIIPIPYNLGENAVTCNFLDAACPVVKGQQLQYQLKMFIESYFPDGVATTIEFRIVDESSQPFVCLRVPIRIEAPVGQIVN